MKTFFVCIILGLWTQFAFAGVLRFEGDLLNKDIVEIPHAVFSTKALPVMSLYFSNDNGITWYQDATIACASAYGSSKTVSSYSIVGDVLRIHKNYCTSAATHFQVVVYQ